MGNTIVVVEHNEEFIKASDWIVEIGPGAGDFGGELVFNGSYEDFLKSKTLTADFITGKRKVCVDFSHRPTNKRVEIRNARKYNLKNIKRISTFPLTYRPNWNTTLDNKPTHAPPPHHPMYNRISRMFPAK